MWTVDRPVETGMNNGVDVKDAHIQSLRRVVRARSHPQDFLNDT